MQKVKVVSVKDGGYYTSKYASGSTVDVVLQRGDVFASCKQILIWEDCYKEEAFDEWMELADAGEEGYATWTE
jgi:hypothetical protein